MKPKWMNTFTQIALTCTPPAPPSSSEAFVDENSHIIVTGKKHMLADWL